MKPPSRGGARSAGAKAVQSPRVEHVWLVIAITNWVIRLTLGPYVIYRQRNPSVAVAWLALTLTVPWLGLIAYALVGEPRLGYGRRRRYAADMHLRLAGRRPAVQAAFAIRPGFDERQKLMVSLAENLGGMPILGKNAVELIAAGKDFIERLVADIDGASRHVHLLFFIFEDDETGRRVGESLLRAVKRGVKCRLLADAAGSWWFFDSLGRQLAEGGVDVQAALPVGPVRRRFARADLRNHRKLAVIDGRVAYTGSHNVSSEVFTEEMGAWQDLSARIMGPTVGQLQAVFLEDWHFETGLTTDDPSLFPDPVSAGNAPIQVVPTGPGEPNATVRDVAIEALHLARRRVIITTPYFIPDEALMTAIRLAAARGVEVDLVLPSRSDKRLCDAAARFFCGELVPLGVRVHFHQSGLLHAKVMTVDEGFAMLGSANFDVRSFFLNFELNLLLYDDQATAQVRFAQQRYISESIEVAPKYWLIQPWYRRFGQQCAKLLSAIL